MSNQIKKGLKLAAKIAITIIIIWLIFKKIDFQKVIEILSGTSMFWLSVSILLYAASKFISSLRLFEFFKAAQVPINQKDNLRLYWIGMFYNIFLPGGIGGDGYKVYYLNNKFRIKVKDLITCLLLDRISGLFILLCITIVFLPFITFYWEYKNLLLLSIPIGTVAYYLIIKYIFTRYTKVLTISLLQSSFVQLLQLVSAFTIILAFGCKENYLNYLFVFLISSVVSVIPLTIGGIGSREITFLFASEIIHLDINISIALSVLFYLSSVIVSLTGAYYVFSPSFKKIADTEVVRADLGV